MNKSGPSIEIWGYLMLAVTYATQYHKRCPPVVAPQMRALLSTFFIAFHAFHPGVPFTKISFKLLICLRKSCFTDIRTKRSTIHLNPTIVEPNQHYHFFRQLVVERGLVVIVVL